MSKSHTEGKASFITEKYVRRRKADGGQTKLGRRTDENTSDGKNETRTMDGLKQFRRKKLNQLN